MFTRQSSQLVDHRAARMLPVIMSAVVVLTIVAVVLATRPFAAATTVKTPASQQYDSPALRQGIGPVSVSAPQYDSPALRKMAGSAAAATIIQSADELRKEHVPGAFTGKSALGEAAAANAPTAATTNPADAARREHLAPIVATPHALPAVTGRDRIEIHRLEHLGKAATLDTWGGGR